MDKTIITIGQPNIDMADAKAVVITVYYSDEFDYCDEADGSHATCLHEDMICYAQHKLLDLTRETFTYDDGHEYHNDYLDVLVESCIIPECDDLLSKAYDQEHAQQQELSDEEHHELAIRDVMGLGKYSRSEVINALNGLNPDGSPLEPFIN